MLLTDLFSPWPSRTAVARALLIIVAAFALSTATESVEAQQIADAKADVSVLVPAFAPDAGPIVAIDSAHHNFHTIDGRYAPFAALLRNDGFRVKALSSPVGSDTLENIDVLVVANALNSINVDNWTSPTPSAFTIAEIAALKEWVVRGGSLLLIADHFPFPGAVSDLAKAFGFTFINGFVFHAPAISTSDVFTRASNALRDDVVLRGRPQDQTVNTIATFTGSAFQAPKGARALIVFPEGYLVLMPHRAWEFDDLTPRRPVNGYLQGAVMPLGKGRLAIFGEAAMFTAQVTSGIPSIAMGFNSPEAIDNKQFILNVMRWLGGILPP